MRRGCNPLCRSFRDEAQRVQRDMDDALRLGMPRNEETTTETLLLNLARNHPRHELRIETFTGSEEGVHGADWEFWFANDHGLGVAVRIQAKRLFPSGNYDSLFHQSKTQKTKRTNQCRELIRHAGSAIPIYVFYNSTARFRISLHWVLRNMSRPADWIVPDWGISMCSAYSVQAAREGKDNRPENLDMVPWHCMVCSDCWPRSSSASDLPSVVGNSLQQMFELDGDLGGVPSGDLDRGPHNFEPTDNSPHWVGLLKEEPFTEAPFLEDYMRENNLRGVAIIEQPKPKEWEE
jgi:hypothetical protein